MKMQFEFKPGMQVVWSKPDSRIAPFCSRVGCSQHIPDAPVMFWNDEGACCQLCDDCVLRYTRNIVQA